MTAAQLKAALWDYARWALAFLLTTYLAVAQTRADAFDLTLGDVRYILSALALATGPTVVKALNPRETAFGRGALR